MKSYREIFSGSTALITGGARRIGRALALELASLGVGVVVHYNRSGQEAREVVETATLRGGRAWAIQADLANPAEAEGLLLRAVTTAGPLDYLINNASSFHESGLDNLSANNLLGELQVNACAPLQLCRAFAGQKRKGAIINMLDTRIHSFDREHVGYHLSKRALFSLTRMLAWEYAPHVRVNAIAPGVILPPEGEGLDWLEKLRHSNPLDSYGTVEDVTDAALFLLASEFITGEVIHVDGGRHIKNNFYGC